MHQRSVLAIVAAFCLVLAGGYPAGDALAAKPTEKKIAGSVKKSTKTVSSKKSAAVKGKASTKKRQTASAKQRLRTVFNKRPAVVSAPGGAAEGDKFAAVVVDADSGHVLYEKNAGALRYPASLTKMMTLYLTFDALKRGKLQPTSRMTVSAKAAGMPETNINLAEGDRLSVRDAIESLVVRSANDASVVLAEQLGGTTWNFAQLMNQKARELGMRDTVFRNPNGLPDDGQYTSAYDMARLGIALRRDFPEYYDFFKTERFDYEGVTYTTHNRVMLRYDGADGIKTGYIRASGFNLVTSVSKNGHHIVAVVMGGKSATARDDQMISLLDRTFADLAQRRRSSLAQSDAFVLPAASGLF